MQNARTTRFSVTAIFICQLVCCARQLQALDPQRKLSQYVRKTWEIGSSFPNVSISSMAQSSDGYLWIGTDKGLFRFDGLDFEPVTQTGLKGTSTDPVRQIVADDQSNLWVLLANTGVFLIQDGRVKRMRNQVEQGVISLGTAADGSTLFSSLAFGPLQYKGKNLHPLFPLPTASEKGSTASPDDLSSRSSWGSGVASHHLVEPGVPVSAIAQTQDGTLWLAASNNDLFRFVNKKLTHVWTNKDPGHLTCLLSAPENGLWIGTDKGLYVWRGTSVSQAGLHADLLHTPVHTMVADRDSNLWIGTDQGIIRVTQSGSVVEHDAPNRRKSVSALFVDRDGELWVGAPDGLERLRDSVFASPLGSAAAVSGIGPVYAGQSDKVWFAPLDRGLYSIEPSDSQPMPMKAIQNDSIYTIVGRESELWAGTSSGGLLRLRGSEKPQVDRRYTVRDGLPGNSVYALHLNRDGSVWLATLGGGVSHLVGEHFVNYTFRDGLAPDQVNTIEEGPDQSMWFGTRTGLSNFSNGHWKTFTVRDGLPNDNVTSLFTDGAGTLWIGTIAGLTSFKDGVLRRWLDRGVSLREAIFAITQDHLGKLWLATSNHIASLVIESQGPSIVTLGKIRQYGTEDGLPGTLGVGRSRTIDLDPLGRVWVVTNKGLAVANPSRQAGVGGPTLAQVTSIDLDGMPVNVRSGWEVPPGQHRLSFSYSSVNLTSPANTRFRYKLDGFDSDWSAPVSVRSAVYTNLGAGPYCFHVVSGTEEGDWTKENAPIAFKVDQVWYRTQPVEILCIVLGMLAIWWGHRRRVARVSQTINARFEERLAERTRIARDLHDTLLQTLQGSKFVADYALESERDPVKLREVMKQLSDWLGRATEESRAAVNSLRSRTTNTDDIKSVLLQVLSVDPLVSNQPPTLVISGKVISIASPVKDEICLIGAEAIRNAQRHSNGTCISVEIHYKRSLILRIVDDGDGIPAEVLRCGKPGHFGLSGMRERAERIGGSLAVNSRPMNGTAITLTVPGDVAYERRHLHVRKQLTERFSRLLRRSSNESEKMSGHL